MFAPAARAAVGAALLLSLGSVSCGAEKTPAAAPTSQGLSECRAQWHDVAKSVQGLDEDAHPSALASRWETVLATVDYYETTTTSKDCQKNIESQVEAITALRQFSTRLQPYDMEFQADQVTPDVGRYLADPLPAAVRNKHGKLVQPPTKAAVSAALDTLTAHAPSANADLQPGWGQLASVELTDAAAVTSKIQDLAFLAKDSAEWSTCNQALAVIATAIRAQKG